VYIARRSVYLSVSLSVCLLSDTSCWYFHAQVLRYICAYPGDVSKMQRTFGGADSLAVTVASLAVAEAEAAGYVSERLVCF
jgi:hypothetical protein